MTPGRRREGVQARAPWRALSLAPRAPDTEQGKGGAVQAPASHLSSAQAPLITPPKHTRAPPSPLVGQADGQPRPGCRGGALHGGGGLLLHRSRRALRLYLPGHPQRDGRLGWACLLGCPGRGLAQLSGGVTVRVSGMRAGLERGLPARELRRAVACCALGSHAVHAPAPAR